ncbi:hypothetical protein MRX96_056236 [Rhipicephalus microplus]
MAEGFWRRWRREYLLELRSGASVPANDIEIKETFKGRDGRVRACSLKLSGGTVVKRPIQLLYPLEVDRQ